MSCILRASGDALDVDAMVARINIQPDRLWRKGERRTAGSVHKHSGVSFVASDADFDDPERQVSDAVAFIERNMAAINYISAHPNVESVELDFGRAFYEDRLSVSTRLPLQLIRLAASAGICIEVSVYACRDDSGDEG